MATVWTFGDSMTERYNPKQDWAKSYIDWKGYVPKVYGNFVSEMMEYDLKNLGKSGCDNYTIFETFCKSYSKIKDEDIVIIGWTSSVRFRMVNKDSNWQSILPYYENRLIHFECLSENTVNEILINRMNYRYGQEINNWINFINSACTNKKIIHWSQNGNDELNAHHFFEMERIHTETNNVLSDLHFSENGHKDLADKLINLIFSKNNKSITNKLI